MKVSKLDIREYFSILSKGKSLIFVYVPAEYLLDKNLTLMDKFGPTNGCKVMCDECNEIFDFKIVDHPLDKGIEFMDFVMWDIAIVECKDIEELADKIMYMHIHGNGKYYAEAWHDGEYFDENI